MVYLFIQIASAVIISITRSSEKIFFFFLHNRFTDPRRPADVRRCVNEPATNNIRVYLPDENTLDEYI